MYSNCGFMAFPLIAAVLGDIGVFYGSAFVGVFNLSLWTHGRALLLGRRGVTVRGALCNAGVLGTIAGALIYFCRIPLPEIAGDLAASLASLNTPLAMIVIGVFLPHCTLRSLFRREVLWPAVLRTVLIPCCYLALLCLLRVSEQCADDSVPRHGLRLRLAHHPHDKHPVCYLNPHIIVSGRFAVMRIDKRSQSPYTVYHTMIYGR